MRRRAPPTYGTVPAGRATSAVAPRLRDGAEVAAGVRHGAGRPGGLGGGAGQRAPPAPDPRLELAHGLRRLALRRAPRQHHLDVARAVDADSNAVCAGGAADPV